ncbi:uncharacterized protein LOC132696468 isoform X2 [Cylas formicarius]|nr:uncharacterized protein LOC132696468 isoform X2 [Cylas formicarius]XP_060517280.1 uncharacterized protein LOC132696468 isoform X2 [Cylas formicarius]XP_060517281.1 uncharacterized protein LOC132696468 isoform X2 [Cylas formicarius]XP_060517282.1 uncharacterized protein LOC132696468 isoform X2 [Cylas formicarius]
MHGVKRVMVFCVMTTVLPSLLIITPLYLKHSVFADITYPVAESDVVAMQEGVSSIFCESLSLRMNSSFNAFLLKGTPQLSSKRKHIRLKKSMMLPDDTLEYWGFYLLKGASVKLKVCSRYEGSRILVVRGEKNLRTCGLLEHNYEKYGAKFDTEHNLVKVTYENPAEVIGLVDKHEFVDDTGGEDLTNPEEEVDIFVRKRIEKGKARLQKLNATASNNQADAKRPRRHMRKDLKKLEELRRVLSEEMNVRRKRNLAELDAHIKHGGNALNATEVFNDSASVSSFETDLLTCYDGQILLTQGFPPSHLCNEVTYLDRSNHMVTTHEVASDGYYYYIFYSDNDFVKNDIHAVFDIYKPTYRYANTSSIKECVNSEECKFHMGFMSDEVVIVEVPTRDGIEHEADDITYLTSTCHPRMSIYMIFPILVLLLILGCAFM